VFLHTHTAGLRPLTHSAQPQAQTVNQLFIDLADIFHCWSNSQILRRELQTAIFNLAEHSEQFAICKAFALGGGGKGNSQGKGKPPNLLLTCLQLLLPLTDNTIDKEDRMMVDLLREKLSKVRDYQFGFGYFLKCTSVIFYSLKSLQKISKTT